MKTHSRASILVFCCLSGLTRAASAQVITEFRLPGGSQPFQIARGPGGTWFTEVAANRIGLITPDGQFSEFTVPRSPNGIVAGPDGNLWFTSNAKRTGVIDPSHPDGYVSRMTPTGVVTDFVANPFSLPGYPSSITVGPDGLLWFTDCDTEGGRIGQVTLSGRVTNNYIQAPNVGGPTAITQSGDGNLWFTVSGSNGDGNIGRVAPSGTVTLFPVPGAGGVSGTTWGFDGNLWFTETNANKIGRITPSGVITEFSVSGNPQGIVQGYDRNLWFTESAGNKIGRITTRGDFVEFAVPTPGAQPWGIAAGPDGNIWFTERGAGQIGRVVNDVSPYTLRLGGGRFHVTVGWVSPADEGNIDLGGEAGALGIPVPLSSESGYFYFSDPANVEVVVKVLDWCPGGGIQFFAAGLTNFRVEMEVTDTQTGLTKHYENPQGATFRPVAEEFSPCTPGSTGDISGAWTGKFDPADFLDCDGNTPAQASFTQNGTEVVGTLNATGNGCGFTGVTLRGTLQANALVGTVTGDRFSNGTAAGSLSGAGLEIALKSECPGALCIPGGQLHLHR